MGKWERRACKGRWEKPRERKKREEKRREEKRGGKVKVIGPFLYKSP